MNEPAVPQQLIDTPADRPTLVQRVDTLQAEVRDLKEQRRRQDEHLDALHRVLDQVVEQVRALGIEVGAGGDWHPMLDTVPDAIVSADRSRRARRAEAKFAGGQPS